MNLTNDQKYYIIGMSPGNSYFKDEEIKFLLKTAVERFDRVLIMFADVPAIQTYVAFGYPLNRARREKAIPQGNLLKNKVKRAMATFGYTEEQVRILDWAEEVEVNSDYQKYFLNTKNLYNLNESFQKDCDDTTREVLVGSGREIPDLDLATKTAVHYLLSEFAFLEWGIEFLNVGKVIYVYHKNWPVYENYIAGKYDGMIREHLDFLLLENPFETFNPMWGLEENKEIKTEEDNVLRIGFSNCPPAFICDKDNNVFSGFFYEILKEICNEQNLEMKFTEEVGYGVVIDGLLSNRFDVFGSTIWPTEERRQKAIFSVSVYESKIFSYVSEDNVDKNISDLRVVVKQGDVSDTIVKEDNYQNRIVYAPQLVDPIGLLEPIH